MPQNWDLGQILLHPLQRKACWGFLRPKNPTASAGFEPANLGATRPPKPSYLRVCLPVSCPYCKLENYFGTCIVTCILNIKVKGRWKDCPFLHHRMENGDGYDFEYDTRRWTSCELFIHARYIYPQSSTFVREQCWKVTRIMKYK